METYGGGALTALGDPTRRAIFECLARGPKAVGQLASELPVSRPAVSQHLRVLKEAGLVADRAAGTRRIYQIEPQGVRAIHAYLDQMWGQALASFQEAAMAACSHGRQRRAGAAMTEQAAATGSFTPVRCAVTVPLSLERAFALFTEGFFSWWPHGHHLGKADLADVVLEPRTGGRYYERGVDGSECDWGQVLACDPPHRIVVSWRINANDDTWFPDPTLRAPANSRSRSWHSPMARPGWSLSTATLSGTGPAGKASTRASPPPAAGSRSWTATPRSRPQPERRAGSIAGRPGTWRDYHGAW